MKNLDRLIRVLVIALFSVNLFAQTENVDRKQVLQELLVFKNQNLFAEENYEKQKQANKLLNQIGLEKKEAEEREKFPFWSVRYVWETNKDSLNPKFAVMESMNFITLPGQQTHKFYFFDKDGNLIGKEFFSTGWRMIVGNVELIKNNDFEFPIVKISSVGGGSFAYNVRAVQYYALLEDSIVLIRLESKSNSIFNLDNRNSYGCEYPSLGPKIPQRTPNEWLKFLNSENKVEILRTLLWLAGKHEVIEELNEEHKRQVEERKEDPALKDFKTTLEKCPEIVLDIKTYETVKNNHIVQKRLQELAKSPVQWIKEAAELALKPIERKEGY
jgi:hypothetical protein